MQLVRIALVGAGHRGADVNLPVITAMRDELRLVAVCDADAKRAEEIGSRYNVPYYSNVEKMLDKDECDVVNIATKPDTHLDLAVKIMQRGVHVVVETPITQSVKDADLMIESAEKNNVRIEVSEQFYCMPMERLKRAMIEAGVFGRVQIAEVGTGLLYHAASMMRNYVGFDNPAVRVTASGGQFSPLSWEPGPDEREQRREDTFVHALIEFRDGNLGIHNRSTVNLDVGPTPYWPPQFMAERGCAAGSEEIWLFDRPGQSPQDRLLGNWRRVRVERKMTRVDGREVLAALIAHSDPPVVWENPFRNYPLSEDTYPRTPIAVAAIFRSIARAASEGTDPGYGPVNARHDMEINNACAKSMNQASTPVELPA